MKGKKGFIKVSSLLLGTMLLSILMYGVFNIFTTTSQAYPPFVKATATPTPTTATPTPTGEPTPTPTPTAPPTIGKLVIQTIPQEDQLREKGIMILCPDNTENCFNGNGNGFVPEEVRDLHAEYKIDIRLNGVNTHPDSFSCNVIEKEVCHIPPEKGVPEIEATELFDVTNFFKCELNDIDKDGDGIPDGVGVMEVFYTGNPDDEQFIGDHIIKVEAEVNGIEGAEIQDLCILGFPNCGWFGNCTLSDKKPDYVFSVRWSPKREERIWKFADPIFPFASCKNAALWQRTIEIADPFVVVPDCTIIIP